MRMRRIPSVADEIARRPGIGAGTDIPLRGSAGDGFGAGGAGNCAASRFHRRLHPPRSTVTAISKRRLGPRFSDTKAKKPIPFGARSPTVDISRYRLGSCPGHWLPGRGLRRLAKEFKVLRASVRRFVSAAPPCRSRSLARRSHNSRGVTPRRPSPADRTAKPAITDFSTN